MNLMVSIELIEMEQYFWFGMWMVYHLKVCALNLFQPTCLCFCELENSKVGNAYRRSLQKGI